ncbi:MAG: hypothetical protein ACXABY_22335 [Candidatus Thorarchaeota archaeon]|jgi:hypothetical protein
MVTNKRKIARRVVIGYVVLGSAFVLLWYLVIGPTGVDPLIDTLFYISFPAILASPYVMCEIIAEVIRAVTKRSESNDYDTYLE